MMFTPGEDTDHEPKRRLWKAFCSRMGVMVDAVPLFDTDGLTVRTSRHRTRGHVMLRRSPAMEGLVIAEVDKLVADFAEGCRRYDGLIYMMLKKRGDDQVPLYIGKAETLGKSANLSANIVRLSTDRSKFARWGDGYAYHIGDLSAAACPGHAKPAPAKYMRWAGALFANAPSERPDLRESVFFWCKAWRKGEIGPFSEFGPASLTALEYLLIGLAGTVYPADLLNSEGKNRV